MNKKKRICKHCGKPMFNSLNCIWISEKENVDVHSKCAEEFNSTIVAKIITNAVEGKKKPSRHEIKIFRTWYKKEFASGGGSE